MRKQMEGDNQRRRAMAREARERGLRPSEARASLSASKQITSLDQGRRNGPPPAGRRKPNIPRGGPAPPPAAVVQPGRPLPQPGMGAPGVAAMGYQELVGDVSRRAGVDFRTAKVAAEATVLALAWALEERERERLLQAVPLSLHDVVPVDGIERHDDLAGFLAEVARISGRTPEQARYQAEATLAALAEQDGDLIESLRVPDGLRDLLAPPEPGGGVVGPTSAIAPLTDQELRDALSGLPYWSSDRQSLVRTIELPAGNLDRVLDRLDRIRTEIGRGPQIGRPDPDSAVITVRTQQVEGVSAQDVDLAHRIDDAIDEAGAGVNYG